MRIGVVTFCWVIVSLCYSVTGQQSSLVYLDDNDQLVYTAYANQGETDKVNQIPDFSWAGYQLGGVALPEVPVIKSISAVDGDNRQHIQQAIDQIASLPIGTNGFRGTLLLTKGRYECSGPLYIKASGIVLRGEKQDYASNDGTQIVATATYQHHLIQFSGSPFNQAITNLPLDTILVPQRISEGVEAPIDGQIWLKANVTKAFNDITSGGEKVSFRITADRNDYSSYHSKEGGKSPYISITYRSSGASQDSIKKVYPSDDAYVQGGDEAQSNFGDQKDLVVKFAGDNNRVTRESFLKFVVPQLNGELLGAELILWCNNAGNALDMLHFVYHIPDNNWTESTITYANKPSNDRSYDKILSPKVGVGKRKMRIENAGEYRVGQKVVVLRTPNQAWIDALQMGQYGWTPDAYKVAYNRTITAISGDTIVLDAPMVHAIDQKYGGGEVYANNQVGLLANCGIERLMLTSNFTSDEDEDHGWSAVKFSNTENCWVKNVSAQYFGYSCVDLSNAHASTIQDCAMLDPKSITTGSRKYSFNINSGSFNLFQRCYTRGGRHDFVTGSKVAGPNVFLDCLAQNTFNDIGPHHRYATGVLFDNISGGQTRVQNRKDMGTGHGWAGAQTMFWNVEALDADIKVESPIGAMNWGIGCAAGQQNGAGFWENWNNSVLPRSLYLQQLKDRLGDQALTNIASQSQLDGTIYSELEIWAGLESQAGLNRKPYEDFSVLDKIEMEHFDIGANGETYMDVSRYNQGYSLRVGDVDVYAHPARVNGKIEEVVYVGDVEEGEWLEYTLDIPLGTYEMQLQYASDLPNQPLVVLMNNTLVDTVYLPKTTSLVDFSQVKMGQIHVQKNGKQTLRFLSLSNNLNLDWIELSMPTKAQEKNETHAINLYPNPSKGTVFIDGMHNIALLTAFDATGKQLNVSVRGNGNGSILQFENEYKGMVLIRVKQKDQTNLFQKLMLH